jgi:hypothetical protein
MPFVCLGGLNFILHCCIYPTLKMSLVLGAVFSSIKNMQSGSFVLRCLILKIFVTVCPSSGAVRH